MVSSEFTNGAVSGTLASLFSNPFETVKTRLQLQGALNKTDIVYRNGTISAIRDLVRTEGFRSLWKGCGPNLCFNFVVNGCRFGIYGTLNHATGVAPQRDGAGMVSWFNGTLAGGGAALIASPFALVRTQLQSQSSVSSFGHTHQASGMVQAFKHIVLTEGVRGAWRGASAQVARVGFTTGLQLAAYDSTKQVLCCWLPEQISCFLTALSTGVFTALVAHPLDVILVRLYNQTTQGGQRAWYSGPIDAAVKTVQAEGWRGLYKGFGSTVWRQMPHTMVTFMCLEHLRARHLPSVEL